MLVGKKKQLKIFTIYCQLKGLKPRDEFLYSKLCANVKKSIMSGSCVNIVWVCFFPIAGVGTKI